MKRLDNIKLYLGESEDKLIKIAQKSLGGKVKYFKILKKSLDARDKNNIAFVYSVVFSDREERELPPAPEKIKNPPPVAVVGSGPAGLFCAVRLVEHGFAPVIIERGEDVDSRTRTNAEFFKNGVLNEDSNVQFGEGGAGTYSDGKLYTRTHDGLNGDVIKTFVRFGAPREISYLSRPHIGSDRLKTVLKNIRAFIEGAGGKYLFNTKFVGFTRRGGALGSLILEDTKTKLRSELVCSDAVLALGHSAGDAFMCLNESGIAMQPREFAVGVRIEHLNASISRAQYGENYKLLPSADYSLVSHAGERTAFTFCMCPGGYVIPAASRKGGVVTNGMSLYARDGVNSNSALMVQLNASDFGADDLFAGMRFQRRVEEAAFSAGGGGYKAPVQKVGDFLNKKCSAYFGEVLPTYSAGVSFAPMDEVLPSVVCRVLRAAIPDMDKKLKGFAFSDAVLTGVETRFSSPVRILRGEENQSVSLSGLYPCGEGSGYSGGITSSAADGLRTAEKIFFKYKNH